MMVAGHLQIKNEKYYMVLELRTEQGERKTKWIGTGLAVKGNKRRAEAMLEETRTKYLSPVVNNKSQMPFAEYMGYWLEIVRPNLEENTYAGYKSNIEKRIVPFFKQSGVTLGEIKAVQIQEFYTYCQMVLHVSNNTVIHYHANLMSAFKYALKMDFIRVNPMNRVKKPKPIQHNANFYSAEEAEKLIATVHGDTIEFPVMMAAYYGLRRSEIAGLRWRAIDFKSNRITIEHTVTQAIVDGERKIIAKNRAKNKSSCRSLPLMPQFKKILLQMKKQQETNRKLCGNCYHESEYVYVNQLGIPYTPDFITDRFRKYLKKAGFRKITFHELRHPYVKHTTKIFSLRSMAFQAQAYPDARRKTRGAYQLHRVGQSQNPVRPLCNRKRFSCSPPQSKMSWILYAISMRLSGYTSTRSISSSASSVVSVSASKIALDASLRLSCRACSSCFFFACANTAA